MTPRFPRNAAAAAAFGLLALAPLGAWATGCRNAAYGTTSVEQQLDTLRAAIEPTPTDMWNYRDDGFTNLVDQLGMLSKVDEAYAKTVAARGGPKWGDALGKLYDISDKVDMLVGATKPKLTEARASAIKTALDGAVGCLSAN